MPSLIDSTPQPAATGDWSSLYASPAEPVVKAPPPRHGLVVKPVKPAYGGGGGRRIIKNLEMCTEALGCETGGVDVIVAAEDDVMAAAVETDGGVAERKRRAREDAEAEEVASRGVRRALPPPLTTLARGGVGSRVRMVQERRDGRLAVYAVRTAGVQAERCGGRLRLRLVPCAGCSNATECHRKAKQQLLIRQEAEEEATEHEADADEEEEEEYGGGVAKYVRGGRCVDQSEVAAATAAAAARRGKGWEPERQAAARIWVATT